MVGAVPFDAGGCSHYRIRQPLEKYAELTGRKIGVVPHGKRMVPFSTWSALSPDFILTGRQFSAENVRYWKTFKRLHPEIPLYMDFDDNLWNPHADSTFKPSAEDLRNLDEGARLADRFIASTKPLAGLLFKKFGKRTHVLPNMIDMKKSRAVKPRNEAKKLRVFWGGTATHQSDLKQIIPVVKATSHRYDWHFMAYVPGEIRDLVTFHDGIKSIPKFENFIANLGIDVGIAPLISSAFNRCKSNVKLLEYGRIGAATICSPEYPYNLSPAVKATTPNDWIAALGNMENEAYRLENAARSQDYSRSFDIASRPDEILAAYN